MKKDYFLVLYFSFCFVLFLLTYTLFNIFTVLYGVPFGGFDVDNYMCWLDVDLSPRYHCQPGIPRFFGVDLVHTPLTSSILFFCGFFGVDVVSFMNFLMPLLLWLVLPVFLLVFYSTIFSDVRDSVLCSLCFLLGTFIIFFFGFYGLWSQFISFLFFMCAVTAYSRGLSLRYVLFFILCGGIFYYYILVIYGVWVLAHFIRNGWWWLIFFSCLFGVFMVVSLDLNLVEHTVFGSSLRQPDLYRVFFFFSNPILLFPFLVGLMNSNTSLERFKVFMLLLLFVMPFSEFGRGMVFAFPFYVGFAYLGLKKICGGFCFNPVFLVVIVLFMLFYFYHLFDECMFQIIRQLSGRGLDPQLIIDYFDLKI